MAREATRRDTDVRDGGVHPGPSALPTSRVTLATVVHPSERSLHPSVRPALPDSQGGPAAKRRFPGEGRSETPARLPAVEREGREAAPR